jgi:hypothetical protein
MTYDYKRAFHWQKPATPSAPRIPGFLKTPAGEVLAQTQFALPPALHAYRGVLANMVERFFGKIGRKRIDRGASQNWSKPSWTT